MGHFLHWFPLFLLGQSQRISRPVAIVVGYPVRLYKVQFLFPKLFNVYIKSFRSDNLWLWSWDHQYTFYFFVQTSWLFWARVWCCGQLVKGEQVETESWPDGGDAGQKGLGGYCISYV